MHSQKLVKMLDCEAPLELRPTGRGWAAHAAGRRSIWSPRATWARARKEAPVNRAFHRLAATLVAVLLGALLPTPAGAAAGIYNVVDRTAADVTADALPTAQIDGIAWDQVIVGTTVYAGGEFANARPAGAAPGTNQVPRSNLLAYDLTTGVLKSSFAPVVNGKVKALAASPDGKKVYIAGNFTMVNGQPRSRVAAFNTADGSLDASFKPTVNSDVNAIVATDTTVWFGGVFSAVNGQARTRLAAASRAGKLLAWAPTADLYVNAITLTPDRSRIAIGGSFSNVNGVFSPGMAFLGASDATLYPFAANQVVQNHGDTSGIYSLKSDGKNILATGWWFAGVGNFEGLLSADPTTGAIRWMADCHGDTYDATTIGATTYSVGHPHFCGNMGSFPEQNPRVFERAAAFTDRATSTTLHDTQGYHDFYGQPAPSQVNWNPDLAAANVSGSWQAAWTAESNDSYLVLGGEFPTVNGVGQQGLVRFALPGIAPGRSGPKYSWDWTPTATVMGTQAKVSWPSNVDRDNMSLTYRLYRSDRPGTPLSTQTGESQWWNRPVMGFLDGNLSVGSTYSYRVTATDPDGNVATSARVKVTAGGMEVPDTAYSQAVQADGAQHYWRLLESQGTTSIDWRGGNDLQLGSGVRLGMPGAIGDGSVDSAAAFDGTANGRAATMNAENAPNTFTAELWFRSTSTTGGQLLDFGDAATGDSYSHDRQLYLGDDGRISFGVWPGAMKAVTSSASYNDGVYHHVVATLSKQGQMLWVDGRLAAADATTTGAQADLRGFWRVGGDSLGGWPGAGSTQDIAATIDEVAIYPTALTRDQIRNHYTASGRSLTLPAQPADAYGKAVLADDPRFLWRLDETRTPVVVDATANLNNGAWSGSPAQLRAPSPVTGATGTGVRLDGSPVVAGSDLRVTGPQVFSVESWFSTTSTTGGKIIGFGNERSGLSTRYDRHLWMDPEGRLNFGVYHEGPHTVTSRDSFNDGSWHHVVGTMGPNGMALYVDGVRVGTDENTQAEYFAGHWRVGGDQSWSGNPWFAGSIDEAAVYTGVLSTEQVRNHYRASAAAVNKVPVPTFTATCEGATCTVDASASTDPDGVVGSWTWDFGDGTKADGVTAKRTYATGGSFDITLTVVDDQQGKASTKQTVRVEVPNTPPRANIAVACTGLECSFDASGSTDADGVIAGQVWDFGDGATSTEANPTHTYAEAGQHTVTLTVSDEAGASHTTTRDLVVSATNTLPTASFTSTVTDLDVAFDASESTDPDGSIASYAWDFGDGSTGVGAAVRHHYAAAGTHTVTLTVTDTAGGSSTRTAQVTTTEAANTVPTAAFEAVVTGRSVGVDASASADADGSIATVRWDFGDGTTGEGATATHEYVAASTYTITLTVTDDRGATATTSRAVTITDEPNQAPVAAFTSSVDGLVASLDASGSADGDGSIASFAWDFGDGSVGTGRTVKHSYAQAGTHRVTLTVTDDGGATHRVSRDVVVTAPPAQVTPLVSDAFEGARTRWGSADVGGTWGYPIAAERFSTASGEGRVSIPAGGTVRALLPAVDAADVHVQADLAVDRMTTGSGLYSSLVARNSSAGNYYLGVRWLPTGEVHLLLYRTVNGATLTLRETTVAGLTYAPGTRLTARLDVVGSTLSGRVWPAGQEMPATPQITLSDTTASLQGAGQVGFNGYLSGSATNGPITVSVDNLTVTKD